jgi:hypothetical protein
MMEKIDFGAGHIQIKPSKSFSAGTVSREAVILSNFSGGLME